MAAHQAFIDTLRNKALFKEKIVVEDYEYHYYVMSRDFNKDLRFFCGAPSAEAIFISEDVPEGFREAVLTHEVLCNIVEQQIHGPDLCVHCSKIELTRVQPEDFGEYLPIRIAFYEDLIPYLSRNQDHREANAAVLAKVEASLKFLKTYI